MDWMTIFLNCIVWIAIVINIYQGCKFYKMNKELNEVIGKLKKELQELINLKNHFSSHSEDHQSQ